MTFDAAQIIPIIFANMFRHAVGSNATSEYAVDFAAEDIVLTLGRVPDLLAWLSSVHQRTFKESLD